MTNKMPPEWVVGPWEIINPHKIVKLGFVFDDYKLPQLPMLWKDAEKQAAKQLGVFDADQLFHQEERPLEPGITVSTRWYTPADNKRLRKDPKEGLT